MYSPIQRNKEQLKNTWFLTLFYINSLSIFFSLRPFSFIIFCLLTPDEDCWKCLRLIFLVFHCISWWVHFSRTVLFCHPHQQLFTHSWYGLFDVHLIESYSHTPSDCSHVYKQPYIICFLETKHVFENKANSLILTSNWVWQKVWPTCRRVMFIPWTFPSSTTPKYAVPPSPEFRKAFKFLLYIKITLCNSAALSERAKSNYLLPPK